VIPAPASAAELMALAREGYTVIDSELAACLAGVSEAAAGARPTHDAWTILEIVAHLLALELDVQTWLAAIIEDSPLGWPFHANTSERMAALVTAYPTLPLLVDALRRAEAANLALLAALPPAVVRRRHALVPVAGHLREGLVDHAREHFAEIRERVESDR
jgi:hypothetical protein